MGKIVLYFNAYTNYSSVLVSSKNVFLQHLLLHLNFPCKMHLSQVHLIRRGPLWSMYVPQLIVAKDYLIKNSTREWGVRIWRKELCEPGLSHRAAKLERIKRKSVWAKSGGDSADQGFKMYSHCINYWSDAVL